MKTKLTFLLLFLVTSLSYSLPFTHYTSTNLRLRTCENLDSEIITVLEPNLGIEIIETGKKETINDISANWVKVKAANGYIGWCFSGYLKPIEKDVSIIISKEIANINPGTFPRNGYGPYDSKNIASVNELVGKEGFYIHQLERRFQGPGRCYEILQLVVMGKKVYVREIDIVNNKIITLKEIEFLHNGKTFVHDNSVLQLDKNNQLLIYYLENVPEEKLSYADKYENPFTKVPDINFKKLVNQTSTVLKNYSGVYTFDSIKVIKNKNIKLDLEHIKKANVKIDYNESKKCLSVKLHDLTDIVESDNRSDDSVLDFIETSASEPFYWLFGEGSGYVEKKFWFYKGGIAILYDYIIAYCDYDTDAINESYVKYVIFLKKEN